MKTSKALTQKLQYTLSVINLFRAIKVVFLHNQTQEFNLQAVYLDKVKVPLLLFSCKNNLLYNLKVFLDSRHKVLLCSKTNSLLSYLVKTFHNHKELKVKEILLNKTRYKDKDYSDKVKVFSEIKNNNKFLNKTKLH